MIRTPRLLLRPWTAPDRDAFAAMTADPAVMEHLPGVLTRPESDALADRFQAQAEAGGYELWAVEVIGDAPFIGFVRLSVPSFMPDAVEIGWWLAHPHWGHGFATEGARAVMKDGFERHGLDEIVSFTVPDNVRSWRVMKRLGMTHDPADDFDHPRFPSGHRLSRHVLYRMSRERWEAGA